MPPGPPLTPESAAFVAPDDRTRWFREEVAPHGGDLKAYLRGSFPAVRDVDDVVQDSYLRIWRAGSTHPIESARAFLFTIARRLALRAVRRQRRIVVESLGDKTDAVPDVSPGPEETLGYQERVALLAEALVALPERCRQVVMLRKLHAVPQKEVAVRLGISERTVENHLAAGMDRCQRYFRDRGITGLL